jgi:maleate isomerase
MPVEYAPKGLIGVFTPQANTTVEPEMAILTPPGHAFINARMTSGSAARMFTRRVSKR